MEEITKNLPPEVVIDALQYIADSPPHEYGGFHPNASRTAKAALTLIETLEDRNMRLRHALTAAQHFIQDVGTEDPEDIETMASIERLSGCIAAALESTNS